jgi:hypothetical protein
MTIGPCGQDGSRQPVASSQGEETAELGTWNREPVDGWRPVRFGEQREGAVGPAYRSAVSSRSNRQAGSAFSPGSRLYAAADYWLPASGYWLPATGYPSASLGVNRLPATGYPSASLGVNRLPATGYPSASLGVNRLPATILPRQRILSILPIPLKFPTPIYRFYLRNAVYLD